MKVALVTGGSRGIGAAASVELAKLGYAVAVNYRTNYEAVKSVCKEISDFGGVAEAFKADISDSDALDKMFEDIHDDLGEISVLVNNAGVAYIGLLQDMSDEEIKNLSDVNLLGAMLCTKRAVPDMIKRHDGVIINIASMWGEVGASCEVVYSACKAGIIGFTKALAKELGPSGIRVNCVSPGVIDTDMNSELTDETISELCEETPLLRIGKPSDVGKTIAFLASDKAGFITGQVISVNGGII
ncbi:MAG: SDR family oxidoreductase [Oscillospiraceae bacterium]|nr:SDR family oxidoreductase [Oscillospiraceae bacterium]